MAFTRGVYLLWVITEFTGPVGRLGDVPEMDVCLAGRDDEVVDETESGARL